MRRPYLFLSPYNITINPMARRLADIYDSIRSQVWIKALGGCEFFVHKEGILGDDVHI